MESEEPLSPDSYAPSVFFRPLFVRASFSLDLPHADLRLARFQHPSPLIPPSPVIPPPRRLASVVRPAPKASPKGASEQRAGRPAAYASPLARKREPLPSNAAETTTRTPTPH